MCRGERSRHSAVIAAELPMITMEDMCLAMDRHELFVEYQPIVLLQDRRCVGAEALVRWHRGDVVLLPSEFVRAITNTPLSGRLTYWLIDTVANDLGTWLGKHPDVKISINVPPEILGRGGLQYAATRSGLYARRDQIVLELTERGIPDELGLQALNAMAERGVRIALDDVSMSGVNLALFARCNFGIIKLDRHLTAQLTPSASPFWLSGLGSLLRNSTVQVVAEGVETHYQAQALLDAGVQMAQGHLFSASLPAPALIAYHASAS
jgi:sensor c-di-GMP phosphodiesterase-like protein